MRCKILNIDPAAEVFLLRNSLTFSFRDSLCLRALHGFSFLLPPGKRTNLLRHSHPHYLNRSSMSYRPDYLLCVVLLSFLFFASCSRSSSGDNADALFSLVPSAESGIRFINKVTDTKEMNILNYHNFYNGGGVAIGDINQDGKPDIFFTANQGDNKLYLNKGGFVFEDITEKAGLKSNHKWHTGVSMADINGDGWLDIYVCNAGIMPGDDRANELYINNRDGSFTEEARKYGLDDKGCCTQALFFDYDHDGDLDCFMLNNSPKSIDNFGYKANARSERDLVNGDRLYRNDGGKFTDVSDAAGIFGPEIAFGLGVTAGDVNNDGWEDIYVANDFFEHDYLYINQHNGTFKEVTTDAMGHMSNGAMGTDMADINNDGYLDLFTAEMLPENDYRLKTTLKFDNYDIQNARNRLDLHHQFTCNTLQLNNQDGTFSEIGQLAGVDATGWSWGTLCFDFDNDGWKDIYVCNGIKKDLTNQDFLAYFNSQEMMSRIRQGGFDFMDLLNKMPSVPINNFAFVNQQHLRFSERSATLGFHTPSFSSGAAYGDLDGDGDMDLVVNNNDAEAFVYRNLSVDKLHHHFVTVQLKGDSPNTQGLGTRVTLYANNREQVLEQMPTRGFQSSVEPVLHFGLGNQPLIDSLLVEWPGGKSQVLKNIHADTTYILLQHSATIPGKKEITIPAFFRDITAKAISGNTRHKENEFVDFDIERLIPRLVSTEGPKLAVADVNGDGLEDFYMGSAAGDTAKIFLQQKDGRFIQLIQKAFMADAFFENTGAAFLDIDKDGDQDLVVVSGGNEARFGSPFGKVRLYLNDGKGNFSSSQTGWPQISLNASCVRILDFNNDGNQDIFIGARDVPGSYGVAPSSILLQNNGKGLFTDVTHSAAPGLEKLGMVTDAAWADLDGDGKKELVVVGDWMPVTLFSFSNGKQSAKKEISGSAGWWNCLNIADLDGNGAPDLVVGNFGINSNIKADKEHPAKLFVSDFDKNGQTECIPVYYKSDGKAYPYYLKDEMESQLPQLKKRFLRYDAYAGKPIEEIFSKEQLTEATVLNVVQTQTGIFYNDGKGNFSFKPLPVRAQFSPVFGIMVTDLDGDGKKDIFMGGNFYGLKPQTGRLDAGYGISLYNKGNQAFEYVLPKQTGLFTKGEVRDIKGIAANGGTYILVGVNNQHCYLFAKNK